MNNRTTHRFAPASRLPRKAALTGHFTGTGVAVVASPFRYVNLKTNSIQ